MQTSHFINQANIFNIQKRNKNILNNPNFRNKFDSSVNTKILQLTRF